MVLLSPIMTVGGAAAQQKSPPIGPPEFSRNPPAEHEVAVLGGLDKITARVTTIEAPLHESVQFGTLSIIVRSCHKRPPEEPPETTAYLEIFDVKAGETPTQAFSGWMFASSPALSALEHPVYDVWVTNCKTAAAEASSGNE